MQKIVGGIGVFNFRCFIWATWYKSVNTTNTLRALLGARHCLLPDHEKTAGQIFMCIGYI